MKKILKSLKMFIVNVLGYSLALFAGTYFLLHVAVEFAPQLAEIKLAIRQAALSLFIQ
jgi:hypothetical protein